MATTKRDLTDHQVQGPPERLLTIRDVAERLSVSTKTIYRLKSEGLIGFVRIRGSLRFREQDVTALQQRSLVTPGGYAQVEDLIPPRLNLEFEVTKRGRGPRRR